MKKNKRCVVEINSELFSRNDKGAIKINGVDITKAVTDIEVSRSVIGNDHVEISLIPDEIQVTNMGDNSKDPLREIRDFYIENGEI